MGEVRFMISEAAKQVKVESHVLRYWEEELDLVIGRTEMGHRYYTKDDIQLFRCIKKLKDEGMLLKDLKPLIPELKATRLKVQETASSKPHEASKQDISKRQDKLKEQEVHTDIKTAETPLNSSNSGNHQSTLNKAFGTQTATGKDTVTPLAVPAAKDKPAALDIAQAEVIPITQLEQVRSLIGDVLTEVVTTNNESLKKEISQSVTKDVIREMDFLFQAKERQEEEHFRKLDCLIRQQQANRREAARETPIGKLKKLLN